MTRRRVLPLVLLLLGLVFVPQVASQNAGAEIWPFSACTADSFVSPLSPDKACNGTDNYPVNSNDRWVSGGLNTDPHYLQAVLVSQFAVTNVSISWGDGASMVRFRIEARVFGVWKLVFGEAFGTSLGKVIPYNFTGPVQADAIKITGLDTSGASGVQIAEIYLGFGTISPSIIDNWRVVLFAFIMLLSLYLGLWAFPTKNVIWLFIAGIATIFFTLEIWGLTANMPLSVLWFGAALFIFADVIGSALAISEKNRED